MRILFYAPGTTGSGHIVRGLSIAAALKRSGIPHEYSILSADIPYVNLARRFGISISTIPHESEETLGPAHYREAALFAALSSINPDILIVDQFWFSLNSFVPELPCRKVMLTFQMHPSVFHIRTSKNEYRFRPEDYDLLLRTEPAYEVPFDSREVKPLVLRNRNEVMGREGARADLHLTDTARTCLFACSGESEQVADVWKSFSYLQDEGWVVVRSQHREGGLFPAMDWFAAFDLLICGAGYSAFWEARWLKKETYYVPFPRRFEDQKKRITCCSDYIFDTNGADELVQMLTGL
jgi:hypothetical protein